MDARLAIVLVAKVPVAGKVKTRLLSRVAPEAAARLHELFSQHTLRRIAQLGLGRMVVLFDPPTASAQTVRTFLDDADAEYLPQVAGDLGQRLATCAAALVGRFDRILFLGCDSPDVPDDLIRTAAASLSVESVVVGPTEDGGFWTLGLNADIDAGRLLADLPWSSGRECEALLDRAAQQHHAVQVVGRWADVDHPADLDALLWRLEHSRAPQDVKLFAQLGAMLRDAEPAEPSTV